jgi:hypothetical protein
MYRINYYTNNNIIYNNNYIIDTTYDTRQINRTNGTNRIISTSMRTPVTISPEQQEFFERTADFLAVFMNLFERDEQSETRETQENHHKCPLCRCVNSEYEEFEKNKEDKEQCVVCMDNHANIKYKQCGHQCVCGECFKKI